MFKPNGYDEAQVLGEYKPLPAGGYVCVIKQVQEQQSRNGSNMLVISLDICEGEYTGHFEKSWRSDTRPTKKWGCKVYQVVEDREGRCTAGFKTFITSVERSNPGFTPAWGAAEQFCASFKNRKIGGLFGREQYEKQDGSLAWSTKCTSFRSVDTIRNGDFTIPEDKPLAGESYDTPVTNYAQTAPAANSGFTAVEDDDLPF